PESRAGQLRVAVVETARQTPTAEVVLGFTLHEQGQAAVPAPREAPPAGDRRGRKVVLVTGAAGGLGSRLVETLAGESDVRGATHRQPLEDRFRDLPGVEEWRVDLDDAEPSRDGLTDALGGRPLYGVVHAAWPGAPLGGLLQALPEVVER